MFLKGGVWQGKRIVSPEWVAASVRPWVADAQHGHGAGPRHYGLLWWLVPYGKTPEGLAWFAQGLGGQRMFVLPQYDLMLVITGWDIEPSRVDCAARWQTSRSIVSSARFGIRIAARHRTLDKNRKPVRYRQRLQLGWIGNERSAFRKLANEESRCVC